MTQQEGNKLIFMFMGAKEMSSQTDPNGIKTILSAELNGVYARYFSRDLKYHTSWDWLKPVVEKIKDLVLNDHPYDIGVDGADVLNLYITAPIETVWEQTVYFLQWYNTTKK